MTVSVADATLTMTGGHSGLSLVLSAVSKALFTIFIPGIYRQLLNGYPLHMYYGAHLWECDRLLTGLEL